MASLGLSDWTAAIVGASTVLGIIVGWVRWVRPRLKKVSHEIVAARDSLLGRDAVLDSITGMVRQEALPGIGVRMAETEHHLGVLSQAVTLIAESHARAEIHEERLDNHEERILGLEAGAVERAVTRAESAAAWRAVQAVAESTPPDRPDPPGVTP